MADFFGRWTCYKLQVVLSINNNCGRSSRTKGNREWPLRKTSSGYFTAKEGFDVGCNTCSPVSELYQSPFAFTGEIIKVLVDVSAATFENLAEQHEVRARFAMATQ